MRMHNRSVAALFLALLSGEALGAGLPNFDAFGTRPPVPSRDAALLQRAEAAVNPGVRLQTESRLGVPTFLWVAGSNGASLAAAAGRAVGNAKSPAESAARAALSQFGSLYGLSAADVSSAVVSMIHDTGRGAIIVKLRQQVGGTDIFREEINVLMNRRLEAVAISGYISSAVTPAAQGGSLSFALGAAAAAQAGVRDALRASVDASEFVSIGSEGGYQKFVLPAPSAARLDEAVRVKPVYYHWPEGLEAAYYVEVLGRSPDLPPDVLDATGEVGSSEAYGYVVSAVNGRLLTRKNLSADAGFTYRVWADPLTLIPYDTPAGNGPHPKANPAPDGAQSPFVPTNDVPLLNYPFSMNDPWLAPGSTETNGNNADAFLNLFSPDGYGNPTTTAPADPPNGDYRAQITAPDQFLHTHVPDVSTSSADARQGSIQQLFYDINFLHDWYYDSGFDEASGNAQTNNFGRGGLGNDNIRAQAQDFSGFNNANMQTPADGTRPRMRMYAFPSLANHLDIQAPAAIVGKAFVGVAISGPQSFDVTNDVVIATFTAGPSTCTITNAGALAGKIAMFDFDNTDGTGCSFSTRVLRITQTTSANAALMVYTSAAPTLVANITGFNTLWTKPVATISWNTGQAIKSQLSLPATVTARLLRAPDRDGTLDNQIVFHEWGHYLSNRLVGNASGIINQQAGGMGEGWGDFSAMMLTVRADDTATPSNATFNGVYALATYALSGVWFDGTADQSYYFGIRRYPYSTDMTKNPLTFKHIQNGVALPVGPPLAFGASGANNAEVHNTGEVWTTMLWECYAALLRDTQGATPRLTFQQAQDRMKGYLVASLKMTPLAPTFTEARDAVLAAAYANDTVDFIEFWQAFAKRGAGLGAVSPDRFSVTNTPVVESFVTGPGLIFQGATLDDGVASCDGDGILDGGEVGHLVVTLKNVGSTTLTATTATVSSATPGVSFPAGNAISFPPSEPAATTTGTVVVAYAPGIAGIQQVDFQVDYNDTQLGGAPLTANASVRANADEIPASTATDTVEARTTPWTISSNPTFGPIGPWARKEVTPLQHVWFAPDSGATSDEYLTSPVFTVDGGGSLNVQFDHSWGFEFDGGGNYDGGVVEMSVNGGAFTDIGTPAYNGTILNNPSGGNPLRGRPGFVQNSAGTVHTSLTQAIAPGSTVQVRFRVGTDNSVGAAGWNVDTVAFTGVVETPFATVVADTGCTLPTTTTLSPSANPSPFANTLTLTATVATAGGPANAGSVTFLDGATPLGTVPVNAAGVATLATSTLTQGLHSLTAQYGGALGYAPSTSNTVNESIGKPASAVALVSSQNPSALGQSVTFTATVSGLGDTPTGSVSFSDGATPLATVALSGGVAAFTTSTLSGGAHTIYAAYAGNATYAASTNNVSQVVTNPTIGASGPTTFCAGGSVTLTASIAPGAGVSYLWSPGGQTTQAIVVSATGNYAVTVTVNGAAGTSAPTLVTVNPEPALPVITAPSTALPGATGLVASVAANAGSTYAWAITNGTITGGNGTNQITFTAGVSGPLGLSVVETSAAGCPSAQATATVSVGSVSFTLRTLVPCRLFDTRNAAGPNAAAPALGAFEARVLAVAGRCGVPSSARALSVNVTAIGGTAAGFVGVYPADLTQAVPVGTTVNFRAGQTRAVNGILSLAADGSGFKAHNMSSAATHILVDVNGWFE